MTTQHYRIAMGSYASKDEAGIQILEFDEITGQLVQKAKLAGVLNPSFVVANEEGNLLFAVSEDNENGEVVSLKYDRESETLTEINRQLTRGGAPCHISLDAFGEWLLGVNYHSGNVFVFPIEGDGRIGDQTDNVQHAGKSVDPKRQQGPHTHSIFNIPGTDLWLVCDLGLDKIYVYELDTDSGKLRELAVQDVVPGSGPRHVTFHPKLPIVYVIEELSSVVSTFRYDVVKGTLTRVQADVSTLPKNTSEAQAATNFSADIHIAATSTGTFLYASNRGFDNVAVFRIEESGRLTLVGHALTEGEYPRSFLITPDTRWLLAANQTSDSIVVLKIGGDGIPVPTGHVYSVSKPVCLQLM